MRLGLAACGGSKGQWAKITSPSVRLPNGKQLQVHQNMRSGLRVEPKFVVDRGGS